MDNAKKEVVATPMLFPYEPEAFWEQMRKMIREEIGRVETNNVKPEYQTPGLTQKPLYKVEDLCCLFQVSKPTIYDWIKHGKLKPFRIRTRVYFLWNDIQELWKG